MSTEGRFDVFLSYSWADLAIATELHRALTAAGLTVFRDETGLSDYDEISPHVVAALGRSRSLVALYTHDFPQRRWCQWELYTALSKAFDLDGHTRRVLPVLHGVDYAEVRPAHLAALRLPRPGTAFEVVAESIVSTLGGLDDHLLRDAPSPPRPRWYPDETPTPSRFRGRQRELWDVHDLLVASSPAESTGASLVRILGLGGQGKTMLAEEYARRFALDHPGGVFVLRGFGSHRVGGGSVAVRSQRDRQVEQIVHALMGEPFERPTNNLDGWLRDHLDRDGRPYLWIVDDIPAGLDLETFRTLLAPTRAGRTLVTTRYAEPDHGGATLMLAELDNNAAVELLTSGRPADRHEREVVWQLACLDLGCHAQAVDLAAGIAAGEDFTDYATLRLAIATPGQDALQLAAELRGELPGGHEASIAGTLLRSIDRVGPNGREVLRVASLLAAAPIPESLLVEAFAGLPDGDPVLARHTVAIGLADAAAASLAHRLTSADPALWSVHAMIIRTLRFVDTANESRSRLRRALLDVIITGLDEARDRLRYLHLVDYLPHVPEVAAVEGFDETHARNETGRAYVELGRYGDAVATYTVLHAACVAQLGEHDATTLAVAVGLGAALGLRGRYRAALEVKSKAYEGLAATLGADHPDAVTALNNIAVSYMELREPARAQPIFADVYRTRRRLLGIHDTNTLIALGNLASAASALNKHRLALRLRTIVHERLRRLRGQDDALTLEALNNLGASQRKLRDMVGAQESFAAAYEGRRGVLGEAHPDTVGSMANLAIVDPDSARMTAMLLRAYRTLVCEGDPDSPGALLALHNLLVSGGNRTAPSPEEPAVAVAADPPSDLDLIPLEDFDANTDWRVELFMRAERTHASVLAAAGPDDPATMLAVCHLAHATAALGQIDQQLDAAAVLIADAAVGLAEILGANHPDAILAAKLRTWIDERAG